MKILIMLIVVERAQAERVAALEDAGHRRPVGHPDDADLEPFHVVDDVRLDHVLDGPPLRVGRVVELVVGGQQRELAQLEICS